MKGRRVSIDTFTKLAVAVILINRSARDWHRPRPASMPAEGGAVIAALAGLWLIGTIHNWLGVWPYG